MPIITKANFDVNQLSQLISAEQRRQFVWREEAKIHAQITKICQNYVTQPNLQLLFVSGPSSSGKTSIAKLFCDELNSLGRPAIPISIDDYYLPDFTYEVINGLPNYETLNTIDLELLAEQLQALLDGAAVNLPNFSFLDRKRSLQTVATTLPNHGLVVVEGLHALASDLLRKFAKNLYQAVFVMPATQLLVDDKLFLSPKELRQYRRMSRDLRHRGTFPLATLDYWTLLDQSESKLIEEYQANSNYFINTCLNYEFALYKASLLPALQADLTAAKRLELPRSSYLLDSNYPDDFSDLKTALNLAEKLTAKLETLPRWELNVVPTNSLLNEFVR